MTDPPITPSCCSHTAFLQSPVTVQELALSGKAGMGQGKGWGSVDPSSQIPVCSVSCCTQGKVPSS